MEADLRTGDLAKWQPPSVHSMPLKAKLTALLKSGALVRRIVSELNLNPTTVVRLVEKAYKSKGASFASFE